MNKIRVDPDRFKAMLAENGITKYALARKLGSTDYQLWRLMSGKHTTSFRYLARLVPVLGLEAVAGIIADQEQREAFIWWFPASAMPSDETDK
jgi:transcriptional regulator with XRE-family HTH domain